MNTYDMISLKENGSSGHEEIKGNPFFLKVHKCVRTVDETTRIMR